MLFSFHSINYFKFGKFQQQLFRSYILKLHRSFCAIACSFYTKNLSTPETIVNNVLTDRKRGWSLSRMQNRRSGICERCRTWSCIGLTDDGIVGRNGREVSWLSLLANNPPLRFHGSSTSSSMFFREENMPCFLSRYLGSISCKKRLGAENSICP